MLRTINSKFYATAALLIIVFSCGYYVLSFYLNEQNQLAVQMLENSNAERDIRSLNRLFYEIRFWERKILEEESPEANARFGIMVKEVRERLSGLQKQEPGLPVQSRLRHIQASMIEYETIFNTYIQLKTSRNLHRTVMDTSYQSLVSNILNNDKDDLFKPLFNLTHFFINYLIHQNESGYHALVLVTDYLGKKIEESNIPDERTLAYLFSFQEVLEKDYRILQDMKDTKARFDTENLKLTGLFNIVFKESALLLKADFSKAEKKRKELNRGALALTVTLAVILFIAFFLFSKSIVTPIRSVAAAMWQVKTGNSSARFDLDGNRNDELIQFGYYFNSMLDSLQESEKKYKNLFDSSLDAILLLDPEKGYLDCNPAAVKMFGTGSKKQFLNLSPFEISPDFQPDGMPSSKKMNRVLSLILENGSALFEWTHRRLDGREFIASVMATQVKVGGQLIIQETIRDISEHRQAQEMMIQSEKMLSVGGLAAGMAHEINNPLAGMLQTADLMTKRLTNDRLPANLQAAREAGVGMADIRSFMEKRDIFRMLQTMKNTGLRMAGIVNNMLSFARKSDAQTALHDLTELLDKTFELATTDFDLKKNYDFKTIKLNRIYEKDLPLVPCEGAKIQQVFLNILRNGAQAMQDAGTGNPEFTIRTYVKKQSFCVEIKDNGPGMDKLIRKRVFEPFYTTKPVGVGTGLGLSVSYFIITENHKGQMSVDSSPGRGATFIISLPLDNRGVPAPDRE
ncbi:MAG: ATP-binding protein [Desulfobacterales bacterium]|nr:ATP-binding protein [Desulfobacterales bacterium]